MFNYMKFFFSLVLFKNANMQDRTCMKKKSRSISLTCVQFRKIKFPGSWSLDNLSKCKDFALDFDKKFHKTVSGAT